MKTHPGPELFVVSLSILFSVNDIILEKSLLSTYFRSTSYTGNMRLLRSCVKVFLSFVVAAGEIRGRTF